MYKNMQISYLDKLIYAFQKKKRKKALVYLDEIIADSKYSHFTIIKLPNIPSI